MCILKGCGVSDSFVMVIGDQMALRRHVFAPTILTEVSNSDAMKGEQCLQHSLLDTTIHRLRVRTRVEQLQPFVWGGIVRLLEAGWTYRRIAAYVGDIVSMVYHCFQQWPVEHLYTRRSGSGRPRSTDEC